MACSESIARARSLLYAWAGKGDSRRSSRGASHCGGQYQMPRSKSHIHGVLQAHADAHGYVEIAHHMLWLSSVVGHADSSLGDWWCMSNCGPRGRKWRVRVYLSRVTLSMWG